jgi:hypothetical protein
MTLPSSGQIGLFDVRTELGIANTVQIGITDTNVRTLAGVPSGQIALPQDFYGKSNYPPAGTFITQYCSGYNLYYRYHDGSGGYYDVLQESNSASCGWPPAPTYSVSTSTTSLDEGYGMTVYVTTTHFNGGTGSGDLYWRIVNNTTSNADFNLTSGVSVVSNNYTTLSFSATADFTTEGTENFYVLMSLTAGGPAVATTSTINIIDTSVPLPVSYSFVFSQNPIKEGQSVTVTVNTTNFGSGTLYWSIPQLFSSMSNDDFSGVSMDTNYPLTISNNTGSFSVATLLDAVGETTTINPIGTNFLIRLRDTSLNSVALSDTILVNENERFNGPNSIAPNTPFNATIYNGVPNTGFSYTRNWDPNAPVQSGTLDGNGSFTFVGVFYPASPVPFTYSYTFTFTATGNVKTWSIYVSADGSPPPPGGGGGGSGGSGGSDGFDVIQQ